MKVLLTPLLFFITILSCQISNAQSINAEQSLVTFEIRNMKMRTVEGTFSGMRGEAVFDKDNISNATFEVCIDAATVNTENTKRDEHLMKEDFFDVAQFPDICFSSSRIAYDGDRYIAYGQLNMHGVIKSVEIPFTYANKLLTGQFQLNRIDYGVGGTGTFMVGDEVAISIVCKLQ